MKDNSLMEMISEQDPEQLYELLDLLGEGSYGSVYKALHKQTGELYAVKIVAVVGEAESL
jgi:serine/threonine protein kinase